MIDLQTNPLVAIAAGIAMGFIMGYILAAAKAHNSQIRHNAETIGTLAELLYLLHQIRPVPSDSVARANRLFTLIKAHNKVMHGSRTDPCIQESPLESDNC